MSKFSQFSFAGHKALVRVDFNVPLDDKFNITDDTRMRATLPTIKKILSDGGCVILMSHLGRPKEGPNIKYSLKHLLPHLHELLGGTTKVFFADDCIGSQAELTASMLKAGEVLLLENLRFYKEEEKGDKAFAEKLSKLGDVYVNDAFGTAHRAHASTAVIAQFFPANKKMFGLLMEGEVKSAEKVLHETERPFTAIIGGAKVSDKILIIENLLEKATDIIIGGGMAYTFMKARGGKIGNSLCEAERMPVALEILEKAKAKNVAIHLPEDSVIADKFDAASNTDIRPSDAIPDGWMGLDIGPKATGIFSEIINKSKTILWNGPMGVFEMEKFQAGTKAIALAVAGATQTGAFSLVGGGDSVAAVNKFNLADKVSYLSTGGGAMLEYFEGKTLPGIAAIKE
ncbi:MAG: phosphoglycerate kinase [Chitinophagaceae bacterium]|jgi:phosphoglycerate kinase|nr:phosphoglycerate kinase [Chitinophagaceae bacterium]MBP6987752.1 phosphoglycerate kinase [Ferruginibacter sp.]NMD29548.1 phosphoglycerate kinase [Bacteroidota bacterium]MBK7090019.1 phosphoglycerate kinase [Chitinophagaceae bacterium]MBK7346045.1 phosphoglycerate kinase [Chitinophagaceae bacterium]